MFGEESSPPPGTGDAAAAAAPSETRIDPTAPGIAEGLPPDSANQRYDDSLSRRPVTTVRPLEDEPANIEAPAPEPQASAPPSPIERTTVERTTVEPVQSAEATPAPAPTRAPTLMPEAVPAMQPAPKPEAQPEAAPRRVTRSPAPSEEQSKVLVSRSESRAVPKPAAEPSVSAPPPAQPRLVADSTALDRAAANAYGGVAARPAAMQAGHPDTLIPAAVVGGPRGAAAPAGGPVVIGGAATGGVTPVVSGGGGGVVVIGGPRGGVVPTMTAAPAAVPGLPAGGEPVAVIQFSFGSSALDARDRRVLRQVADIQAHQGGFIKVVGHSSLFTENMPRDKHMLVNFTTSVARAEAVAEALRREGVPPEVIDVAAVGDREPLYLEVMPSGEAGNRRVEIFLVR